MFPALQLQEQGGRGLIGLQHHYMKTREEIAVDLSKRAFEVQGAFGSSNNS